MIPQVQDDIRQDFTFEALPSKTFRLNHNSLTITGTIDQIQAVEQAVFLILNVERYQWLIYSWNYGVELHIGLDTVLQETFADTATRPYLIQRAAERGLHPIPATAAVLELTTTPASLKLELGERFSIGELNYSITKEVGSGVYEITCETTGEAGNDYGGTVIPIEYVEGLETCTVSALLIPGEDEEDTELFRQRYFNSLNLQAFGGNKAD